MSNKLLPCPFCGGEAERVTLQDEENFGGDVIICKGCDACSRVVFGEKEGLIEAWNCRATQPAASEAETCPTCGENEPFTGSCGTSKDDNRALCRRAGG